MLVIRDLILVHSAFTCTLCKSDHIETDLVFIAWTIHYVNVLMCKECFLHRLSNGLSFLAIDQKEINYLSKEILNELLRKAR